MWKDLETMAITREDEIVTDLDVLRQPSAEVLALTPEVQVLTQRCIRVMEEYRGLGLAAIQLGEPQRICVLKGDPDPIVLINPRIIKSSGRVRGVEGCLSLLDYGLIPARRAKKVTVAARDQDWQPVVHQFHGLLARAAQHEIDHLYGLLIIDRA